MNTYSINKDLLEKVNRKGYCLCTIDKSKTCPCKDFFYDDICKCGVFKKVEED